MLNNGSINHGGFTSLEIHSCPKLIQMLHQRKKSDLYPDDIYFPNKRSYLVLIKIERLKSIKQIYTF